MHDASVIMRCYSMRFLRNLAILIHFAREVGCILKWSKKLPTNPTNIRRVSPNIKIKGLKTDFFHQLLGNCVGYVWDYVDSLVQTGTTRCNQDRSHVPKPLPTLVLTRGTYSLASAGSTGYTGDIMETFGDTFLLRVNSSVGLHALSIQCEIMWGYGALTMSRVWPRESKLSVFDHRVLTSEYTLSKHESSTR